MGDVWVPDTEEKYLKRGEFGEVILHLLLRDFIETVPLISKIHFKDADGITIHGFDAVHIGPSVLNHSERSLYLGESKLYNCGKTGVRELINDIKNHFKRDFLRREFALISKKQITRYLRFSYDSSFMYFILLIFSIIILMKKRKILLKIIRK